jgi:hypothetical protein
MPSAPESPPRVGRQSAEPASTRARERRDRVQRIVAAGERAGSSRTPGPVGLRAQEVMMRVLFRTVVTERSAAWMTGLRF